jgi:hypothetical protein
MEEGLVNVALTSLVILEVSSRSGPILLDHNSATAARIKQQGHHA